MFHALYHLSYIFSIAVFAYLTWLSANAEHLSPEQSLNPRKYSDRNFDLETWACDLHTSPELRDPDAEIARVCLGERATRGLSLAIGLVTVVVAVILQLDRVEGRRLLDSWKVRARSECEIELDD